MSGETEIIEHKLVTMMSRNPTFVAGCLLTLVAAIGLLSAGVPTIVCPLPAITVTPAFFVSPFVAVFIPSLLFFAWSHMLFRKQVQVPKRSLVLLAIATSLTPIWFVAGWHYGLQYQGRAFVYAVGSINVVWLLILWIISIRYRHRPSFAINLVFHWLLFAWLAWYAFPYLGELP